MKRCAYDETEKGGASLLCRPSSRPGEHGIGLGNEHLVGKTTDYCYKVRVFQIFNSAALGFRGLGTPPRVSLPPYRSVFVVLLALLLPPSFPPSLLPSLSIPC